MYSKKSRYQKQKQTITTNTQGNEARSSELRILPDVSGEFLHTVEDGDRLDHLAYKYYKQPGKWWRICDANPEFLSPLAFLGKDPVVSIRCFLAPKKDTSWNDLICKLTDEPGIEDVQLKETEILKEKHPEKPNEAKTYISNYDYTLIVTFNNLSISKEQIEDIINNAEFDLKAAQQIERTGKQIVIPANAIG